MTESVLHPDFDDEPGNDSPFCECNEQPTEDEDASNQCFACGKPLHPSEPGNPT